YAVVSQAKLNDRDWTRGREACIVVEAGPTEGERERLLNGFWATFRPELDAIEAARAGDGLAGVAFHPGSAARH
ncbi:hypothetical protein ACS229_30160, partial [Klebsiella pneumoniae]|uniref:hypothetical protein n=1 Tax=Klebsiella pneumoniae TaxID=573 RepID=UPI003F2365E9